MAGQAATLDLMRLNFLSINYGHVIGLPLMHSGRDWPLLATGRKN